MLDIFLAFIVGFRFDTVVILFGILLIGILNIFLLFINNKKLFHAVNLISIYFCSFVIIIFFILLTIDQQYYLFFQNHLNILVFGLIEDDTLAVLKSMNTDNPLILISILWAIISYLIIKLVKRLYLFEFKTPAIIKKISLKTSASIVVITIYLLINFIGLRNSFGVFPLKLDNAYISSNNFVNQLVPNGIFTLRTAFSEKKFDYKKKQPGQILKSYGFSSVNQALSVYFDEPPDNFTASDYKKYLYQTTNNNLKIKEKLNVVFLLLESWSNYFIDIHNEELNLLGGLESHFHDDYVFRNFLSATRGTIYSLEDILINTPIQPITSTKHRLKTYNSSVARLYKENGYETYFITSGDSNWRKLNEFLKNQFFDHIHGRVDILKALPEAKDNTWGVYDEFLFEYIQQILKKDNKPKFIFALTTTNHTPYEIPSNYKPKPIKLSEKLKNEILCSEDIAEKSFLSYQYMNESFGNFLSEIKNSSLSKNTIVGASGDHNNFTVFPFDNNIDMRQKHSVPFYVYMPQHLRGSIFYNPNRYGSHKDIFPTLFNLSFSNQKYFGLGNNLFENTKEEDKFISIHQQFQMGTMNKEKIILKAKARKALLSLYINENF
ncbi:MAG: LTA synthase family protein [Spirochaetia bacterium]|nr:LTA synthase family protein [Spirochaetia bacterium]